MEALSGYKFNNYKSYSPKVENKPVINEKKVADNPVYSHLTGLKNYNSFLISFTRQINKGEGKFVTNSDIPTLDNQEHNNAYQLDNGYRTSLAQSLNCDVKALKSVVGQNELEYVLKNVLNPENFSRGGVLLSNIKNGTFRATMHMHTQHSDGKMSVKELLDQVARYAEKISSPVYIAITDHWTVNGAVEALKIIKDNPQKYEKVRFIPGTEFTAKLESENSIIGFDVLGYCLNPFDEKSNSFLQKTDSISKKEKHKYSLLPTVEEIAEIMKNNGIFGLAHPGEPGLPSGTGFYSLLNKMKMNGCKIIEGNYQYSAGFIYKRENVEIAQKTDFLQAGGVDSHGNNIFSRYSMTPMEIEQLLGKDNSSLLISA